MRADRRKLPLIPPAQSLESARPNEARIETARVISPLPAPVLPFLIFLPLPQLDGSMAGDVGFDPLGLSSIAGLAGADLYWMREAELKHCRIAMLAVVGVLWCDTIGSLPGFPSGTNQMKLFWEVWAEKPQYVAAGFIACGIIESEPLCLFFFVLVR